MLSQITEAYTRSREMGATTFGMHTMICSNDLNYENMIKTIRMLIDLSIKLKKETGISISFINMGGGIGIPYKPDDKEFDLEKLVRWMKIIQNGLAGTMSPIPDFYMESGRYMTGPHGFLVNRAINRKDTYQTHVGVQCAMPGLMRPAMYDAYHHIDVVSNDGKLVTFGVNDRHPKTVNIVGPICENCDRLATQRSLPEIHVGEETGDFIVTHNCGAHAAAMGFNYNGRPRPGAVLFKEDKSFELVVRPETDSDLLARTAGL